MSTIGFYDAMDERLYRGGCQMEQYETCYECGDDIGDDAVEIDGLKYCPACINHAIKKQEACVEFLAMSCLTEFDRYIMGRALKNTAEELLEDYDV